MNEPGRASAGEPGTEAFVRDRTTILAYGALGVYAYYLYGLGPILAFLHDELGISHTLTTLHSSLWAAGTIVTGLLFDRISRRIGRHRTFWLSAAGTAGGALLFSVSHTVGLTLLSAALLGNLGTLLQTGTSVVLSDRHGKRRDRAFVEANIGASAAAVFAPVLFGFLHGTPVGWRTGFLLPVVALGALFLVFHRDTLPVHPPHSGDGSSGDRSARGRLPAAYWLLAHRRGLRRRRGVLRGPLRRRAVESRGRNGHGRRGHDDGRSTSAYCSGVSWAAVSRVDPDEPLGWCSVPCS